jgi:hypothetical protein
MQIQPAQLRHPSKLSSAFQYLVVSCERYMELVAEPWQARRLKALVDCAAPKQPLAWYAIYAQSKCQCSLRLLQRALRRVSICCRSLTAPAKSVTLKHDTRLALARHLPWTLVIPQAWHAACVCAKVQLCLVGYGIVQERMCMRPPMCCCFLNRTVQPVSHIKRCIFHMLCLCARMQLRIYGTADHGYCMFSCGCMSLLSTYPYPVLCIFSLSRARRILEDIHLSCLCVGQQQQQASPGLAVQHLSVWVVVHARQRLVPRCAGDGHKRHQFLWLWTIGHQYSTASQEHGPRSWIIWRGWCSMIAWSGVAAAAMVCVTEMWLSSKYQAGR